MSEAINLLASGVLVDWERLTGQSKFVIDMVTIPIFSAFAGLITNWTGVWMLFAPVRFAGFHVPGLQVLFPYLPRRVQVLPTFAPGGKFGFQGFIPARAEKMASLTVDKAISKIGGPSEFFAQLEPTAIAAQFALLIESELRPTVDSIMAHGYPSLWAGLPPQARELVYRRVAGEIPEIADRAFAEIGAHIDELLDVKTMVIDYLRTRPTLMKDVIHGIGAPELRFMVRSGLFGFPLGILLALYLQIHSRIPVLQVIPAPLIVLIGSALVGVVVNIIAVRVVFTPALPSSRLRYPWGQALFAQRQEEAATDFGHAIAHDVITMEVIVTDLLHGSNGDKTRGLIENVMTDEIDRILGRMKPMVRLAGGGRRFEAIQAGSTSSALAIVPALADDAEFSRDQAVKLDRLCTQKLRELPPDEFVDLLYSAIEQDAWLLYLHGGILGVLVGAVHLAVFGA